MRKKRLGIVCCALFLAGALAGCGAVGGESGAEVSQEKTEVKLYSESTDIELFQKVPVMTVANGKTEVIGDMGAGNEVITINGSELTEYWNYLDVLEESGFDKYVDNGEDGLNGNVYSATMTKDDLVLTVMHMVKTNLTYIVAEDDIALSERLIYKDEYTADNIEGAKTTLHMVELSDYGNSFVIQLKNGHFILNDGARPEDLEPLIAYLEELAPEGEKPVVEAWMVSHPHGDHAALFQQFDKNWTYADRIYVEGIYMDLLNSEVATEQSVVGVQLAVRTAAQKLKTTDGKHPEIYRPQAGQTYYFSDIKIEVMQTMLQCPEENWYRWTGNVNEFSTWLMYNIEGQKFLNAGDGDFGSMRAVMRTFDKEYLEMDIMAVQHHGINVHNEFSDFISVKTLLYPNFGIYGSFEEGQSWGGSWQASVTRNEYLQKNVLESLDYLDGTMVLTFPYKVGEAKSLGNQRTDRVDVSGDETRIQYY